MRFAVSISAFKPSSSFLAIANRLIEQEKEFENPRQKGRKVKHHRTVTPTFAYNAGKIDTVGLLDKIFQQKHGLEKLKQLQMKRFEHLARILQVQIPKQQQIMLPVILENEIIEDLARDPSKNGKLNKKEGEVGTAYAKIKGVKLARPKVKPHKRHADYEVYDEKGNYLGTLDFMYVAFSRQPPNNAKDLQKRLSSIRLFNERLHKAENWGAEIRNIEEHLEKADKVPILITFLDGLNRAKLFKYVSILPKEKQAQFEFLEWEQ